MSFAAVVIGTLRVKQKQVSLKFLLQKIIVPQNLKGVICLLPAAHSAWYLNIINSVDLLVFKYNPF